MIGPVVVRVEVVVLLVESGNISCCSVIFSLYERRGGEVNRSQFCVFRPVVIDEEHILLDMGLRDLSFYDFALLNVIGIAFEGMRWVDGDHLFRVLSVVRLDDQILARVGRGDEVT